MHARLLQAVAFARPQALTEPVQTESGGIGEKFCRDAGETKRINQGNSRFGGVAFFRFCRVELNRRSRPSRMARRS